MTIFGLSECREAAQSWAAEGRGRGGDWIKVLMVSSRWESSRGMQKVKGGGGRKKGTEHKEYKFLVGKNG